MKLYVVQVFLLTAFGIEGSAKFSALFKVPTNGCGSFLCASDAPSLTGTVTTVGLCSLWCQQQTGCQRFNWRRTNQSCAIYFFEPREYIAEDACSHYMISSMAEGFVQLPCGYHLKQTVVYLRVQVASSMEVFLRGGIDHSVRPGCTNDTSTSACAIFISTMSLGTSSEYDKYNAWRYGNNKLNWYGSQPGQGTYQNRTAQGTPIVSTSSIVGQPGYQPDNTYGPYYWKTAMLMDCTASVSGWFEIRGYMYGSWEQAVSQVSTCQGAAGGTTPYSTTANHLGRCGYRNVFEWAKPSCQIDNLM